MPVGSVGGGTKAVVEGGASPSGVGDTNDDANGADIDEVAAAGGPKRGVGVWPVLVVVIAGGGSTEVAAFIIVPTVGIGPVSVGVVGVA